MRSLIARVDASPLENTRAVLYSGSLGVYDPIELFDGNTSPPLLETHDLVDVSVYGKDQNGNSSGFSQVGQSDAGRILGNSTFQTALYNAFGGDQAAANNELSSRTEHSQRKLQ